MGDAEILGSHLSDIVRVYSINLSFEAAAGAILNPNRKTLILDRAGCQIWTLPWLQVATSITVLGFTNHSPFL
jgi:hypothetical protein